MLEKLNKKLADIAAKSAGTVSIGFMGGAKYEDGTPIANVAYTNEFGVPSRHQPPRPFFRNMIRDDSGNWAEQLGDAVVYADYDGEKALNIMGDHIAGMLVKSINDLTSPALAQSTIDSKGFGKPLIDSAQMLNHVTFKVDS